jgi:glutamine synthetase
MALLTVDNVADELKDDIKVTVAGIDADGMLRGKVMAKEKFLSTVKSGFGFSSAVYGWDMHDAMLPEDVKMASENGGYSDFIAVADLSSFRRLPFFLLRFLVGGKPVAACPRGMMLSLTDKLAEKGFKPLAGGKSQVPEQSSLLQYCDFRLTTLCS